MKKILLPFFIMIALASCQKKPNNTLKIAATAVPHAEMLEFIKEDCEKEGVLLDIFIVDDYTLPNRALSGKEVDANFFQHLPFLQEQMKEFNYKLKSLASIHIEPLGIYSKKWDLLNALPKKGKIAIPIDPTNGARALALLHHAGMIKLKDPDNLNTSLVDILENPHDFLFLEIDPSMMARTLADVDAAALPTNFALQAKLSPLKEALILEDSSSSYANLIVVREEESSPGLECLKRNMTSEKMRTYLLEKYQGALLPAF